MNTISVSERVIENPFQEMGLYTTDPPNQGNLCHEVVHFDQESVQNKEQSKSMFSFNKVYSYCKSSTRLFSLIITQDTLSIACSLISSIRYVSNCALTSFARSLGYQPNQGALGGLRFASAVNVPLALYHLVQDTFQMIKGTINEKVDAALSASYNVGWVGDSVCSLANAVQGVGLIAANAVMWTTPLAIVCMCLELAGLVLTVKALGENIIFSHKLSKKAELNKTPEQYTIENYQSGMDYLVSKRAKEKSFWSKHFMVKREDKLVNRLLDIELEAKEAIREGAPSKAKKMMHHAMSALRKRVTTRMISNGIAIVAAVVGTVGVCILLFAPGAQPVGFALLALSVALGFARMAYNYETTRRFENDLELNGKGVHRNFIPIPSWLQHWSVKRKRIKKWGSFTPIAA